MHYLVWILVGSVTALVFGASPRRHAYRPNANGALFAGAFGALVGGVIGDGVPHTFSASITPISLVFAVLGALVFCWAVRERTSDAEP